MWEVNPSGPFDRWPAGLGFEYFYGFIGYGTSQWEPNLYRNTDAVEPPAGPEEGCHLTTDLVDDAIEWVRRHDAITPSKPFFLYFATGATHSPFHVPKHWVDKFKGRFDQGRDRMRKEAFKRQKELGVIPDNAELTPRPKELAAWDSLSAPRKKLLARQMEVYAGFVAHTDYETGRLLDAIRAAGHVEDTIVFYIADDNGPTAEGGVDGRDALTAEGVIVAQGGRHGGFTLYIKDGRVMYETSAYGHSGGSLAGSPVPAQGKMKIVVEVTPVGSDQGAPPGVRRSFPMVARLTINGRTAGELKLRMAPHGDTLDIGGDLVSPVSPKYTCPFTFTGNIESVTIDLL